MFKLIPGSKAPSVQSLEEAQTLIALLWDTQLKNLALLEGLEEKLGTGANTLQLMDIRC